MCGLKKLKKKVGRLPHVSCESTCCVRAYFLVFWKIFRCSTRVSTARCVRFIFEINHEIKGSSFNCCLRHYVGDWRVIKSLCWFCDAYMRAKTLNFKPNGYCRFETFCNVISSYYIVAAPLNMRYAHSNKIAHLRVSYILLSVRVAF